MRGVVGLTLILLGAAWAYAVATGTFPAPVSAGLLGGSAGPSVQESNNPAPARLTGGMQQ